jgi:hypothetical protein
VYDCECVSAFNIDIYNTAAVFSSYFSKLDSVHGVKAEGSSLSKLIDTENKVVLPLPVGSGDCIDISVSEKDSSLFLEDGGYPVIVDDSLYFEFRPVDEGGCFSASITLTDNCSECDDNSVTLSFHKVDITAHKYTDCSSGRLGVFNCGGTDVPGIVKCTYYKYVEDEDEYVEIDGDAVDEAGVYKVVCVNEITGDTLNITDSIEVEADELKIPFIFMLVDCFSMDKSNLGKGCDYLIRTVICVEKIDKDKLDNYRFDLSLPGGTVTQVGDSIYESQGTPSNPHFGSFWLFRTYRVSVSCDSPFSNTLTFSTLLKADNTDFISSDLLVCDTSITLPTCCSEDCNNCVKYAAGTNYSMPLFWNERQIVVTVDDSEDCAGKTISRLEYSIYPSEYVNIISNVGNKDTYNFIVRLKCYCKDTVPVYYICATLDDGSVCCDTLSFPSYNCCDEIIVRERLTSGPFNVLYSFTEDPGVPFSLSINVSVADTLGGILDVLYNDTLRSSTGVLPFDISHLPLGEYRILVELEDKSLVFPMTLVGNTIIDFVSIIPTVTESLVNVSYGLTRSPSSPLRIYLVDFRGDELVEVYNAVPAISGELSVDLSSCITGIYFLVFSIYDDVLQLPVIISRSIIKQ